MPGSPPSRAFASMPLTVGLRLLRPHQWYKQLVLLLALVFSRNLFDLQLLGRTLLAMLSFTAVAGSMYTLNDVLDAEKDRNHPVKQHRPVASGAVSPHAASALAVVMGALAFAFGWSLGLDVVAVLLVYVAQNLVYSYWLKQIALVELAFVATGFVLRAVAGAFAIDVALSPWLVLSTFLLALNLVVAKRYHELIVQGDDQTRVVLAAYSRGFLEGLLRTAAVLLLSTYALYVAYSGGVLLVLTVPGVAVGVTRFYVLVTRHEARPDPRSLLGDAVLAITAAVVGGLLITSLYA